MARIEEKSVTQPQTTPPDNLPKERPSERLKVVGIGASAGGVEALQSFFSALPASTGLAFVVVTHLDPERESILGELLQAHTTMPVRQVHSEEVLLQPDHVYVNAPAQRLLVTGAHLTAHEFDEPHNWHMPIDSFFRSLASAPNDAIAILLSGGGADGTLGMKSIKEAGGFLMVQDPNEARQDSMPRSAITTGLVDLVGSVSELAQKLIDLHQCPPRQPTANDTVNSQEVDLEENAPTLADVGKSGASGHPRRRGPQGHLSFRDGGGVSQDAHRKAHNQLAAPGASRTASSATFSPV
jgi:chemotaxis response regulator CheB